MLLALWDGDEWRDAESVRGGTAQVVHFRQWGESDAEAFAISRLFPGETSRLDLTPSGPLIHVMTPRMGTETDPRSSPPDDDAAGKMRLWQEKRSKPKQRAAAIDEPLHIWKDLSTERLGRWANPFLKEMVELNNGIAEAVRGHAAGVERQVGYIRPQHGDIVDRELFRHLEILRRLQATTDMAAQGFQRKLMGEGDTAMRSYADFWKRSASSSSDAAARFSFLRSPYPGASSSSDSFRCIANLFRRHGFHIAKTGRYARFSRCSTPASSFGRACFTNSRCARSAGRKNSSIIARSPRPCACKCSGVWRPCQALFPIITCASILTNSDGFSRRCAAQRSGRPRWR